VLLLVLIFCNAEVARHVRVCAVDRTFFTHYSPNVTRDCTTVSKELDALLQAAEIPPPYILVGHSAGGVIAQHYSYVHPEKVSGLVLVDTSHEDQVDKMPNSFHLMLGQASIFYRVCQYLSGFGFVRPLAYFNSIHSPPTSLYSPAIRDNVNALLSDPVTWMKFYNEMAELNAWLEHLKKMRVNHQFKPNLPLAVITASDRSSLVTYWDKEQIADSYAAMHNELSKLSQNSVHRFASKSNQYVHLQQPEVVNTAILEVLQKLGYSVDE